MTCVADAVAAMFLAWNAPDENGIRRNAVAALTTDVEFVDPDHVIRSLDEWVGMVGAFRSANPMARPRLASRIDTHHDPARYAWAVELDDGTALEGVDVIAFEAGPCRIRRIDSFVGRFMA